MLKYAELVKIAADDAEKENKKKEKAEKKKRVRKDPFLADLTPEQEAAYNEAYKELRAGVNPYKRKVFGRTVGLTALGGAALGGAGGLLSGAAGGAMAGNSLGGKLALGTLGGLTGGLGGAVTGGLSGAAAGIVPGLVAHLASGEMEDRALRRKARAIALKKVLG